MKSQEMEFIVQLVSGQYLFICFFKMVAELRNRYLLLLTVDLLVKLTCFLLSYGVFLKRRLRFLLSHIRLHKSTQQ